MSSAKRSYDTFFSVVGNDYGWMKPDVIAIIKQGKAEVIRYLFNQGREARR